MPQEPLQLFWILHIHDRIVSQKNYEMPAKKSFQKQKKVSTKVLNVKLH